MRNNKVSSCYCERLDELSLRSRVSLPKIVGACVGASSVRSSWAIGPIVDLRNDFSPRQTRPRRHAEIRKLKGCDSIPWSQTKPAHPAGHFLKGIWVVLRSMHDIVDKRF